MRHSFLAVLIIFAILVTGNHLCFAQTDAANSSQKKQVQAAAKERLKKQVEKIGIGGKITVIRLDERKFYGSVSGIEDDNFQITDVDTQQTLEFKYAELKKVKNGDGERNLLTGKRANPNALRGWLYGAAIFGTLLVILLVGASNKNF